MKRFRLLLWLLAALFAALLAVANRSEVAFSLDPLPPPAEEWTLRAPLYAVIFAAMFCGILLGGFVVWLGRRKAGAQSVVTPGSSIIEGDTVRR